MANTEAAAPPCAGKDFEHHDTIEQQDYPASTRWRCTLCGTTGDGMEVNKRLFPLGERAHMIRQATALAPVILLPSGSPPKFMGHFMGYEIYRVQGIEQPMVAISGA